MSAPLRMAVIGTGNFGTLHAETLAALPGAELSALVDPDTKRATELAQRVGAKMVFASLDELIDAQAVDGIVVATRADSHLPLAAQAAKAGLHVLVEKPLAHSAAEIRSFQASLGTTETVLMVDHLCLFHSLITPLARRLRETSFRALHFTRHRPESIGRQFPHDHPIQLTMVHDLYVAAYLVHGAEPEAFAAWDSRNADGRVDMSWASLRWADGRTATFQCHMMLPEGSPSEGWDSLEAFGDGLHTKVVTNPAPWTWTESRTTWPVNLEIHADSGMLAMVWTRFLAACRGADIPGGCRFADALQVQVWIERLLNLCKSS